MALHNHPRISEATRRRICGIAEKMGYRPNALVSALMSHVRSNRRIVAQEPIAFLTSGPTADWWRAFPGILANFNGATARAEQLGFRLESFWMGPNGRDGTTVAKVLRARALRGAIMAPRPVLGGEKIPFDWPHYAVTTIGYSFQQEPMHRVAHDHVRSMLEVYERLRSLNYRRIGLAMHIDEMIRVKYNWLAGFLTGQELFGGTALPCLIFDRATDGKQVFFAWLKKHQPDAVVGISSDTYFWLKEAGVRIPRDLSYAHLNLFNTLTEQKVAGIKQQSVEIGAAAVDLLVAQLYHNEYGAPKTPGCTLIDGDWMPGETAPAK